MYLDVDRKNKKFMIRDSYTQDIRYNIPEWLMEVPEGVDSFVSVALRFMWVDNDTIRVANNEGIERLVDLKNNFKEIEFNVIPMFNKEWSNETFNHHYHDAPPPEG
jgi:hypothetical protein